VAKLRPPCGQRSALMPHVQLDRRPSPLLATASGFEIGLMAAVYKHTTSSTTSGSTNENGNRSGGAAAHLLSGGKGQPLSPRRVPAWVAFSCPTQGSRSYVHYVKRVLGARRRAQHTAVKRKDTDQLRDHTGKKRRYWLVLKEVIRAAPCFFLRVLAWC
jgi:hypothetical protein